jgi:molybdopterin-binding protein
MKERVIGKVISVDSFRVFIKLDDELKSLYKSGFEDIYEVARINSYVIIPIGADKIVAMVTSVKALDETELNKHKEAIFLTKSARYLVATMIGTIQNDGKYIQGVYNYPILDNPVWYVTRADLDNIFDQKESEKPIDFKEDFYLPIGTSPSFSDYKIKINPDKFFGKHAAILGNTGSGKSCTFASIVQSLFEFKYNDKELNNAHIIIFDTNGEYKSAFTGTYKKFEQVNPFHITKEGMKVPFWFMNFADFEYLFEPTSGTQVPVFKRAIALAKNQTASSVKKLIPQSFISKLEVIINDCDENNNKIKNTILSELELFITEISSIQTDFDKTIIISSLNLLLNEKGKIKINDPYPPKGTISTQVLSECSYALKTQISLYNVSIQNQEVAEDRNIDLPIQFNYKELLERFFDEAILENENTGNRLREYVSTLRLRLQAYLSDERISQPLLLGQSEDIPKVLAKFLAFILGDFCKIYDNTASDLFSHYYAEHAFDRIEIDTTKPNQLTIIDMSLLPYEVLETVTGLIGRLILEFVSRFPDDERGKFPVVLVLEEAQNYIPEKNKGDRESIAKKVFERIAREGRKYGVSLLVTSQRPSELSKTVLSQCNSFIIHRLQNPEDQKYIRQLVSAANEDILQQLPILPQQHVIVLGDAVRTPVQARMNTANPIPNSNNPDFIKNWILPFDNKFPDYMGIAEAWEKGEKYSNKKDEVTTDNSEASNDHTTVIDVNLKKPE